MDRATSRFLGRHPDYRTLCDVVFIEHPHASLYVCEEEHVAAMLLHWTAMECELLYRSATGEATVPVQGNALRGVLQHVATLLPILEANGFNAGLQAAYIEKHDPNREENWIYVHGATVPGRQAALWPTYRVPLTSEAIAQAAREHAPRGSAQIATASAASSPGKPARLQSPRIAAPRSGGVREIIWKVADEVWAKHGKPTDKQQVLALRKRMMEILESDHSVKRTSSSNELGNWQKARVNA